MITARDVLEDQLAQVDRDLAEIDTQVTDGELDEATAVRLRASYLTERASLVDRIASEVDPAAAADGAPAADDDAAGGDADTEAPHSGAESGRSRNRVVVGSILLFIGFVAVTVVLLNTVTKRAPGELATGGIVSDVATNGGVDLSSISNEEMEAVIAENPDIPAMRLALARRYFEVGDFSSAIPHFLIVLEQDDANAEALSSVGWITYLDGRSDIAIEYLDRSIALVPGYEPAYWFRANVRVGLGDEAGAAEDIEVLLGFDTVPDDIVAAATELLASLGDP